MSRILMSIALLGIAFSLSATAEARHRDITPPGSYNDSCRDLYVEGNTLYGECQNSEGRWKKTWISGYEYCDGDIYNNDGVLDCNGGRKTVSSNTPPDPAPSPVDTAPPPAAVADTSGLPPGPWTKSCRNPVIDGSVLRATCQDSRGKWRPTWLDTAQCPGPAIDADDGLLICAAPPPPQVLPMRDTLPQGSWVESCRSAAVKGFRMRAECYTGDSQWFITDLNLQKCKSTVSSRQGQLVCD